MCNGYQMPKQVMRTLAKKLLYPPKKQQHTHTQLCTFYGATSLLAGSANNSLLAMCIHMCQPWCLCQTCGQCLRAGSLKFKQQVCFFGQFSLSVPHVQAVKCLQHHPVPCDGLIYHFLMNYIVFDGQYVAKHSLSLWTPLCKIFKCFAQL